MSLPHGGAPEARELTNEVDRLPLTRMHIAILVVCCIGFSFDLAEIAFGNILSAVFSAPQYAVASWELSWLLAAIYIGAVIGAPTLGWLADKFGRQKMLTWAMGLLAVISIAAGASPNIGCLIVSRIIAGISLGAYPPLMFAYLTDILPATQRGKLVVMATAIGYIGPPSFIFFVRALSPSGPYGLEAWRWGFFLAAVGAAACSAAFWRLPESPRWLIAKERLGEAMVVISCFKRSKTLLRPQGMPVASNLTDPVASASLPRFAKGTVFLLVIYFLTPWATVGFPVLSGAVLAQKGINVQDSLLYIGISTFGPILGTLTGGFFVDRFERRAALVGNAMGMGALGLAFGAAGTGIGLVGSALMFSIILALFMPVLVLYAAESVPTENRGRITSWAWTANRVGSALVPIVLLPILHMFGPVVMFSVIAGTLLVFIALILLFGPRGAAGRVVA